MFSPTVIVRSLDHLVLTCAKVSATQAWYAKHLGMRAETFQSKSDPSATPRAALHYGTQKINLHQRGAEFEPKARTALPGTADLCFIVGDEMDLEGAITVFQASGIDVLEGGKVVDRTGARGPMKSIYVRDPDGNLIE